MTIIFLSLLSFGLALTVAWLLAGRARLLRQLRYVSGKLDAIAIADSAEKLLLATDDVRLRELLQAVNRLLELHQNARAEEIRTKMSMRRMLSNVSHDLRTPLTVVLGYAEMLALEPEMDAARRSALLAKVQGKSQEVLSLIDAFFDLARLESGDRDVPLGRVALNDACARSMLTFYDACEAQGIQVEIDLPEETVYAHANEEALERVLSNLVSNAMRYGADGGWIGFRLRADAEEAVIEVSDRGRGIEAAHQSLVFERMYTLEDSRNRSFQGSGLGLTITKRLVEAMHGAITLESAPRKRTTFTVRLRRVT
ncbi:sensor histidine kinase [Paenibacillus sp. TRM 82003]|nr:sensor histidine kinase [Paenibacillus sp. TRM 82003]